MSHPSHLDLVRAWYEQMWNSWDESVFPWLLQPDLVMRGSLGPEFHGYAGLSGYMSEIRGAFPDFHNAIEELVDDGQQVFAKLLYSGHQRGPVLGFEASGALIQYQGAALFSFKDHKIQSVWVLGDIDSLKAQLRSNVQSRPSEA